jgi:hypothetical protein
MRLFERNWRDRGRLLAAKGIGPNIRQVLVFQISLQPGSES